MRFLIPALLCALNFGALQQAGAQPFYFPTANHALYEPGGEERFFVGTAGKNWTSGTFGPVRSEGWQMHEGLDIRTLQRDRKGEPTDPVLASADGTVAYVSSRPALSNYGKYIILRHQIDGIEIYSLYAHLSEITAGLAPGQAVKAGQPIAIMGRTSNTHQTITKDRAHVHFELNLLYNDRFSSYFKKRSNERNDHGDWNGMNLCGLDPRLVLLDERTPGFNLAHWIQSRPELFRVIVRAPSLAFARRYPALVVPNPAAQAQGVAGYELSLDGNGVPIRIVPRAASEITGKAKYQLVSVNAAEYARNHARKYVSQRGNKWSLSSKGTQLLDLLVW
jgi:murein DD-endopeptidase MepM/ murein hydrolase activator NlpD